MTNNIPKETELTLNGEGHQEIIDDDIQHTVGRLLTIRPQNNNLLKGKKEPLEAIISRAIQEERNQWKERLQLSMLEIDRQHKVILATQTALQNLVKPLRYSLQKNTILEEEEDEESGAEMDQGRTIARLLDDLKFQVKQLKVKAGLNESSKLDVEERQSKQRQSLVHLKETVSRLEEEKEELERDLSKNIDKVVWLSKENSTLLKQVQKLQSIVARYNENHSGSAFHLNMVETPHHKSANTRDRETLWTSPGTMDSLVSSVGHMRERTYVEGDQMHSYPAPREESDIIKDRLRKNIYSVRKGGQRSTSVSQCLRCQTLFKPSENNHKACRFHHKGREIKEKFDINGRIEKVVYKWACCKKNLESPGCCFGYHV